MCLAVPGKIISIDRSNRDLTMAKVDFNGMVADVCIEWLPEKVETGDYILAHVGLALSKIDEEEALLTLESLRQMGELTGDDPAFDST